MPKLNSRLPKYSKHKASGQAVVTLNGQDFYLGPYGSKASRLEYDRLTSEWLAAGRMVPAVEELIVGELLVRYLEFADKHYQKNGRPTHEIINIKCAMRPLKERYSRLLVRDFGPLKLKAIQMMLVGGYVDQKEKAWKGVSRPTVNARIGAIKRIFAWAVSEELVPKDMAHGLATVRGLQRGRTEAREPDPIQPVDDATIESTLRHLPPVVADMVRFQRLVGCRPGEVCGLRPCDVDRSQAIWLYTPADHKMQHKGSERRIFVGPRAQEILRPYLLREATAYCFSPSDGERARKANMREARNSKVQPSQIDRRRRRPKVQPGERYHKDAYVRAVQRACDAAFPSAAGLDETAAAAWRKEHRWAPNRLRHAAATEIRRKFGLEAAQVVLGHSRADVTQVYAERDGKLAAKIMGEVG
jgi:integrase